jgi:hypothetical protein
MKQRLFLSVMVLLSLVTILISGCGGVSSSGTSISSGWLGLNADPDAAASLQIDIKPSAVSVRPGQTISLAVLVKNAYGHPLDGIKLLFASQLGGTFDDKTTETENGWASNLFTAGDKPGTESLIVMAQSSSFSRPLLVQSPVIANPAIQLVTSSDNVQSGNPVTLAVGVSENGVPANDVEVNLASTISGDFGSNNGKTENGWFSTTFTPDNNSSGVGTISAMINGTRAEKSISVFKNKVISPALTISVNPESVFQGQTASVIIIAKDSSGAASDAKINLSSSLSGSFVPDDGNPTDGVFFSEFTAGKEVGSATLTVYSGDASASTILSIERPEIVVKVSPAMNTVKIEEKVPVAVLVTDTFSRPIEDAPVYLSAELGCECSPEEGKTNDDGYMFFDFIASSTAGIARIHALTAGATGSAQITVVGP